MFNLKTFDRNEIQRRRFNILSKVNLIKRAEIIADYKLKKSRSCTSVISSNSEVKSSKKRSVINNQPIKRDNHFIFSRNNNNYYYPYQMMNRKEESKDNFGKRKWNRGEE